MTSTGDVLKQHVARWRFRMMKSLFLNTSRPSALAERLPRNGGKVSALAEESPPNAGRFPQLRKGRHPAREVINNVGKVAT